MVSVLEYSIFKNKCQSSQLHLAYFTQIRCFLAYFWEQKFVKVAKVPGAYASGTFWIVRYSIFRVTVFVVTELPY